MAINGYFVHYKPGLQKAQLEAIKMSKPNEQVISTLGVHSVSERLMISTVEMECCAFAFFIRADCLMQQKDVFFTPADATASRQNRTSHQMTAEILTQIKNLKGFYTVCAQMPKNVLPVAVSNCCFSKRVNIDASVFEQSPDALVYLQMSHCCLKSLLNECSDKTNAGTTLEDIRKHVRI